MSWIGSPEIPFTDIGMTQQKWDLLKELSGDGDYWFRAYYYLLAVRHRILSSLTSSQRGWITTIILSLDTEVERRAWQRD